MNDFKKKKISRNGRGSFSRLGPIAAMDFDSVLEQHGANDLDWAHRLGQDLARVHHEVLTR